VNVGMIEQQKDVPEDVIRIQQAWIKAINRVAEALAFRYKTDNMDQISQQTGTEIVIESIIALQCLLVDYGEALVRTDVLRWQQEHDAEFKEKVSNFKKMVVYRKWFESMIETLNKYGLLFDSMPRGYSNVEMKSIDSA
jgi:hypothetical protein